MKSDIEIAKECRMQPIGNIAAQIGLKEEELEYYGRYKAKVSWEAIRRRSREPDGKLILVTAVNPTPAGEGKTTTTVGLGQALNKIGKKAVIALREPSLGPVFGVKGGAAGGGYSQVVPMEDINLHFTGDMHAITAANNLLSAVIDNHIHQGNALNIDQRRILWKRVLDMNDRALRNIIVGLGRPVDGVPRQDSFMITVASEIMAILCLAEDLEDLKKRLGDILVAYTREGQPVYARQLKVTGAMAALLKDAVKPNLVQTLEHTPCIMHGGPFANIAHGCNSVIATKLALKLGDYCVTEAGFGGDLGGEKFLDIKCRKAGLSPQAIVIVATVRALKYNGGADKNNLKTENLEAVRQGLPNLGKHIENMKQTGVPVVVTLNVFDTDTQAEKAAVADYCSRLGVDCVPCEGFAKGGEGAAALAEKIVELTNGEACQYRPFYECDQPIADKIEKIVTRVYGGNQVEYSIEAEKSIRELEKMGYGELPVCMAKTQYSLSDNPALLGAPSGFTVHVKNVSLSAGAGFVVVLTGDIMTMPGLPLVPSAEKIDVTGDGEIDGIF